MLTFKGIMKEAKKDLLDPPLDWVKLRASKISRLGVFEVHIGDIFSYILYSSLALGIIYVYFLWKPFMHTMIQHRFFVEDILYVMALFQLSQRSYDPDDLETRPTEEEIDELCDEWTPEPLVPSITEYMLRESPQLESAARPHTMIDGKEVVNFASANYLGLIGHEKLLDSCLSTIEKCGIGSCGPRSFYGTFDVHLDCETKIAKFLGTSDSILYAYGLSPMFSAIPYFCKKDDIIVVDEGVNWGIQNGLNLSRSTCIYFKHNDMESLEVILDKLSLEKKRAKNIKRFIVIEAVYQNSGQIAPLDEIVRLKEKYRFSLYMDESDSFGVLGHSGRGLTEYYGIPIDKIEVLTAGMGNALAAEGGFCAGRFTKSTTSNASHRVRSKALANSASLPPYLASAAISAINVLEENPNLITELKENIAILWSGLSDVQGLQIISKRHSPIIFLKLMNSTGSSENDLHILQDIVDKLLKEHNVFVVLSKRSMVDQCPLPVGIKLFVSAGHSKSDLKKVCESLKIVVPTVLENHS